MTKENGKRISAGFGVLAFLVMSVGSFLMGARLVVALFRGAEGFIVFGAVAWGVCLFLERNVDFSEAAPDEEDESRGAHLDETA